MTTTLPHSDIQQIVDLFLVYVKNKYKYNLKKQKIRGRDMRRMGGKFVPDDIVNYMLSRTHKSLTIHHNGSNYTVVGKDERMMKTYCVCMVALSRAINQILGGEIVIEGVCYLTPFKKVFDSFPIAPHNVNSGVTSYVGKNKRTIMCFREEEVLKVWIHELLHAYNLTSWEHSKKHSAHLESKYSKYKSLYSESHPHTIESEAYVEFIAQSIYYGILSTYKDNNFDDMIEKNNVSTSKIISKLLSFANCKNVDDVMRTDGESTCRWEEKTSAFGYYVLRYMMMTQYDDIFKKCPKIQISEEVLSNIIKEIKMKPIVAQNSKNMFSLRMTIKN